MDTTFLETLVAVIETGSFAEAARIVGLTPPAVARRIRALESDIGDTLVMRNGRTVRPTASGLAIIGQAHNMIREARDLRALACSRGSTGPLELRLGAMASALTGILPKAVADIRTKFQRLELYVRPGSSIDLYPQVVSGDLDAAIIVEPPFPILKSCGWLMLRQEPLLLIAPKSLRVRDSHSTIVKEPFIRYDRKQWGGQIVDRYLRRNNLDVKTCFEMDALDAITTFVDRRLGVAIVPDWARPWPERLAIKQIALPDSSETRGVGVLWYRASPRISLVQAFIAACQQALI